LKFIAVQVLWKPILKEIESHLTVMRLGYSKWRNRFHTLLPTLHGAIANHARNLFALMEFFLPVVKV
jgi:hypothetical protein